MTNKAAPFILTVFAGAPLTQTIYGFLLMQQMNGSNADPAFLFGLGIASGAAMAVSAVVQGKAGAAGADALAETGKGFSQYILDLRFLKQNFLQIHHTLLSKKRLHLQSDPWTRRAHVVAQSSLGGA